MTLGDISSKISFLTGQDTTSYTNADRLININECYRNVVTAILRSQDDWDFDDLNNTTYPILTNNLVANQQDYPLPTGTLQLKRVELCVDGVNWFVANRFDINERKDPTATTTLTDFVKSYPYYDIQASSVFLYPIPDTSVSGGIKIWISRTVTEFTATDLTNGTATPGFDAQFHQLIAWGTALDFATAKNLSNREAIKRGYDEQMMALGNFYGHKDVDRTWSIQSDFSANSSYK